jgi:hypothetical protein
VGEFGGGFAPALEMLAKLLSRVSQAQQALNLSGVYSITSNMAATTVLLLLLTMQIFNVTSASTEYIDSYCRFAVCLVGAHAPRSCFAGRAGSAATSTAQP